MKAGMCTRSGRFSQRQRAVSEVSASPCASACATSQRKVSPACTMSASVSIRYVGANFSSAAAMPCFTAHSLPVQLAGSAWLSTMVSLSARRATPRPARDVGGAVMAVVVDHDQRERRIVLAQQRRHALRDVLRLVARRHHDGDRGARRAARPPHRRARGRARKTRARTRDRARSRARRRRAKANHGNEVAMRLRQVHPVAADGLRAPVPDAIGRLRN